MLLVFQQMGLGAVWLVSPIQAKKEIEAILKVPSNIDLICLIAVGYPDESPQKERRPVEGVLEFVYYPDGDSVMIQSKPRCEVGAAMTRVSRLLIGILLFFLF